MVSKIPFWKVSSLRMAGLVGMFSTDVCPSYPLLGAKAREGSMFSGDPAARAYSVKEVSQKLTSSTVVPECFSTSLIISLPVAFCGPLRQYF